MNEPAREGMLELVFGLKDGKITHISEVESGLACTCVCPKCGRWLVAKKGNIRIHHFAHEDDSDCLLALETSLHLAAKEILQSEMRIKLPLLTSLGHTSLGFIYEELTGVVKDKRINQMLEFEEVRLEQRCDSIIPDLMVFKKGRPLIIEIKVTHAVDDVKLQKIKQLGISAIEIDLSRTDCSTIDSIKEDVIDNVQNKGWLHNEKEIEFQTQMKKRIREYRLDAWWCDCVNVWKCPITKRQAICSDCDHLIEYEQNNFAGPPYRDDPDYVYCAKAKR